MFRFYEKNNNDRDYTRQWNPKEFPIGSVVYFMQQEGYKRKVNFGIVEEHFPSTICIQLVELADVRTINGISYKDFTYNHLPTRWQKLPKNWTYNTELWHLDDDNHDKYQALIKSIPTDYIKHPDIILDLYKNGKLVNVQDNSHVHLTTEIDKTYGWRIVHDYTKNRYPDCPPEHTSIDFRDCYATYEEAQAVVDAYEAELQRQSNLSNYEYSIEQIDLVLNHHFCTPEQRLKYREFLLSRDRVEDIELRSTNQGLQWKYWKNKRWMNIELNN